MKKIKYIILHCSATEEGADFTRDDIDRWHRQRGFICIGYHYVIELDGRRRCGRNEEAEGAHTFGTDGVDRYNLCSIGICYIGGLRKGVAADTRTPAQRLQMEMLVKELLQRYPDAKVCGHRDLSPDRNHDGVLAESEWLKACPSFDAAEWCRSVGIPSKNILWP